MRNYLMALFVLFLGISHAQLNFKVGYDLSFARPSALNSLIDEYNDANPYFESKMGHLKFISGLEMGVRYGFGSTALEFTFGNMSKTQGAEGILPADNSEVIKKLYYNVRRYNIGYQYLIGSFGYGASIGLRKFRVRTSATGTTIKPTLAEDYNYFSRFHILYELPGQKRLRFTIMPYVEVPWGKTDVSNVRNHLLNTPTNTQELLESLPVFGISFVFYNGPRN